MERDAPVRVLAVGGDPGPLGEGVHVETADDLLGALSRLSEGGMDLALISFTPGGGEALQTLRAILDEAPDLSVVAMVPDEETGRTAVEAGAHDFVFDVADPDLLRRSIRYAVLLQEAQAEVRRRQLTDELTGLFNSRGFGQLADHHLRIADRTKEPVVLLFVRLDGLQEVSETVGAAEGLRLLADTAEVLREATRDSDVLARVGTDSFCVLLTGRGKGAEVLVLSRLVEAVASRNAKAGRPYPLSLSVGAAEYDPQRPSDLAGLMEEADRRLRVRPTSDASP